MGHSAGRMMEIQGERLPFSFHDAPLTVMGHYLLLMSRAAATEVRPSTGEGATTPGDTIAPTRDYVRCASDSPKGCSCVTDKMKETTGVGGCSGVWKFEWDGVGGTSDDRFEISMF